MKSRTKKILAGVCAGLALGACGFFTGCTTPDGADIVVKQSDVDSLFTHVDEYTEKFDEFVANSQKESLYNSDEVKNKFISLVLQHCENFEKVKSYEAISTDTSYGDYGIVVETRTDTDKFYSSDTLTKFFHDDVYDEYDRYIEISPNSTPENSFIERTYNIEARNYSEDILVPSMAYSLDGNFLDLLRMLMNFSINDEYEFVSYEQNDTQCSIVMSTTYVAQDDEGVSEVTIYNLVFENGLLTRFTNEAIGTGYRDHRSKYVRTFTYNTGDFTVDTTGFVLAE